MPIASNISSILSTLPSTVRLVAVSKYHPVSDLQEAYAAGQRIFGESKVQEMVEKYDQLPKDIEWHFIGHLQSNKVKYIAPFVDLIHAVDSEKLLHEINRQAERNNKIINCLLQVHIAQEETKFGFSFNELNDFFEKNNLNKYPNIQIVGLMGMASYVDDESYIRGEFKSLHSYFKELQDTYFREQKYFRELSIGMSGDYKLAIEEGSTLVRIGSAIFGDRY